MSEKLNYDIVILTTSVTRPELHSSVFSNIDKFLDGYNCKWIISIDKVLGGSLKETKDNFYKILDYDNIDLTIRDHSNEASRMSWHKSVRYCIEEGYKYNPSFGYLWLEDDWTSNFDKSLKQHVSSIDNLSQENFFISLVNRGGQLNFNPSIWSKDLFKKYMYDKITTLPTPPIPNAERLCVYTNLEYGYTEKKPESVSNINTYGLSLFKDVGRNWSSKQMHGRRTFHIEGHDF